MRAPTTAQLTRMQDAAEAAMWDTCVILDYDGESVIDDYGKPSPLWFPRDACACGFNASVPREVMGETQVVLTDAVLRLAIDTESDNKARVQITHRHGVELETPPTYEIIGEPARGPSALVLNLRLVTDGSET
jgi:hypothetical protein